jgi:hypothetical protein
MSAAPVATTTANRQTTRTDTLLSAAGKLFLRGVSMEMIAAQASRKHACLHQ